MVQLTVLHLTTMDQRAETPDIEASATATLAPEGLVVKASNEIQEPIDHLSSIPHLDKLNLGLTQKLSNLAQKASGHRQFDIRTEEKCGIPDAGEPIYVCCHYLA